LGPGVAALKPESSLTQDKTGYLVQAQPTPAQSGLRRQFVADFTLGPVRAGVRQAPVNFAGRIQIGPPGANLRNTAQYSATLALKFINYFKPFFAGSSPPPRILSLIS
jgi:hypothetical protein